MIVLLTETLLLADLSWSSGYFYVRNEAHILTSMIGLHFGTPLCGGSVYTAFFLILADTLIRVLFFLMMVYKWYRRYLYDLRS